jgi:hypothetical protein
MLAGAKVKVCVLTSWSERFIPSIVNSLLMKETRSFYIRYRASSLRYFRTKQTTEII